MIKILVVDTFHTARSRTAETLLNRLGPYEVRSVGTHYSSRRMVNTKLILYSDLILCMEDANAETLLKRFPLECLNKLIVDLNIHGDSNYMQQSLSDQILVESAVHLFILRSLVLN